MTVCTYVHGVHRAQAEVCRLYTPDKSRSTAALTLPFTAWSALMFSARSMKPMSCNMTLASVPIQLKSQCSHLIQHRVVSVSQLCEQHTEQHSMILERQKYHHHEVPCHQEQVASILVTLK